MNNNSIARRLVLFIFTALIGPLAFAADVQVTFTQNSQVTTTSQPVATGTFSQLSPTPANYTINTEFKFYISQVGIADPVLGTATGLLYEIPGSGCAPGDYAAFPAGGIALLGDVSSCGTFSAQINAAAAAGAVGTINISTLSDLTFLNQGLADPVTVPTIFISSTLADALLAQLGDTTPPTPTFTVGGSISGLTGSITLQNNGGDNLVRTTNGSFTFATALAAGSTYSVTVLAQPAGQTCTVNAGGGTIVSANITDVAVDCVDAAVPPTPSPGGPAQIPTLSVYGLVLTILGLLFVAGRRIRQTANRR